MKERPAFDKIKHGDIVLIIMIALAAVLLLVFFAVKDYGAGGTGKAGKKTLVISEDRKICGEYQLDQDRTIEIGSGNVCEIKNGKVYMVSADCPDQLCVRSAPISRTGECIVCLPNRVILTIESKEGATSTEGLDAVTY